MKLLGNALNINLSNNVGAFAQRFTLEVGTENENMDGDVGATVLALVWMGRYRYSRASGTTDIMDVNDDDETMDMRIKAEEWVKGQFGGGEEARRIKGRCFKDDRADLRIVACRFCKWKFHDTSCTVLKDVQDKYYIHCLKPYSRKENVEILLLLQDHLNADARKKIANLLHQETNPFSRWPNPQ